MDVIERAANAIKAADTLLICAGAGMGVDSGLPDFRGDEGFWTAYPLLRDENISFVDLANPLWFFDDPGRAWGFYGHRYHLYQAVMPHEGFGLLKKWSDSRAISPFVFTSNVDGHFEKAGFCSEQIYECHGSINYFQCRDNCSHEIWRSGPLVLDIDERYLLATGSLPICPGCGAVARPNILMFADAGWNSIRSAEQGRRFEQWRSCNAQSNVTIIELGAGKAIPTVRRASEATNGTLVRINPRDADGPAGTISIDTGALQALKLIDQLL